MKRTKKASPKERVSVRLSRDNAASVAATAAKEDRTVSFVIDRIVGQHYLGPYHDRARAK